MTDPSPPQNVTAELSDGTTVALECRYLGVEDGLHIWEVIWPLWERPRAIRAEVLPARTQLRVPWRRPEDYRR